MEMGIIKYWGIRTVIGAILYLLGGWDGLLRIMLVFLVIDYITGLLKAISNKSISSKKGFKGIIKKVAYLLAVIVASQLDDLIKEIHLNIPIIILDTPLTFRQLIILTIVGNEGISIVENLAELGCPFPKPFKNLFKKMKEIDKEQD